MGLEAREAQRALATAAAAVREEVMVVMLLAMVALEPHMVEAAEDRDTTKMQVSMALTLKEGRALSVSSGVLAVAIRRTLQTSN